MYKTISFKKKILATAVASAAVAASFSGMTYAQEDGSVEEVMVTGIRASLSRAMDVKREAVGVVDSISSEDIGKMPDSNLAESLQRITGVSINRSNGEGSQITVRGIDPSLNMVTLNGRVMPAVSNNNVGDNASRAFDFGNLASETINGVDVYKTGKANVASGGLGATVNIKTLRPLDAGETKASFGAKVVKDTSVDNSSTAGGDYTPEVSGLYSWVNEEGNFGVSLTGSFQERNSSRGNAFVNNWQLAKRGEEGVKGSPFEGRPVPPKAVTDKLKIGDLYNLPTDIRYSIDDIHRERTNGQLTLQFRPIETLTGTVDYTYSEIDIEADRSQQSAWFNISNITDIGFDNGAVRSPTTYKETYTAAAGKDVSFANQVFSTGSDNNSAGFNLAWDATDDLKLELDYHSSSATSNSFQAEAGLNANITVTEYVDWSKELPLMGIGINDSLPDQGNNNGIIDGGDVSGAMGSVGIANQRTEIDQLRLMGAYSFGKLAFFEDSNVEFGVDLREDSNLTRVSDGTSPRITMGNWGGIDPDAFGPNWPGYFSPRNFGDAFPDYGSSTNSDLFLKNGLDVDPRVVFENMEWMYARSRNPTPAEAALGINSDNFNSFPNGKYANYGSYNVNRLIEEEVNAVFAQFKGSFELIGMPANVIAGVRYEETDVTSTSVVKKPTMLQWDSDNDWTRIDENTAAAPFSRTGSYDNFMPNLDLDVSPIDDVKVRLSYSETIGRPGYNQLRSDVGINNIYLKTATAGNPGLLPMESKNIDLSAEWYYTDDSYVSAGYFIKDISGFIGDVVITSDWYGLRDARNGPRFAQAIANIKAAGGDVTSEDQQFKEMLRITGQDVNSPASKIYADSTDPLLQWATTTPGNDKDAKIDGIELAVQHWFGESGFGVQANYTAVDADVEFDILTYTSQFAMNGLSDSANVVGFYDKDGLQVRIAYNWRDEFLNNRTQGGGNEPSFTEEYSQIDVSVSYDLNENVTLTLEGLNVTGENSRSHGRGTNQMNSLEELSARYMAGVRYSF